MEAIFKYVRINTPFRPRASTDLVLHPPFSKRYLTSQPALSVAKVASYLTFEERRLGIPTLLSVIIYNYFFSFFFFASSHKLTER